MGDGRSDDTAVFQKSIDLAAESRGTVFVPAGVYRVGRLQLRPNTGLLGLPTYSWKGSGGSVLQLADPDSSCLLDLTGALGARIDGLCLDGMQLGRNVHGILVDKPDYGATEDNPLIERCKVTRFTGDGVRLGRIWCFRVRGNMFSENGGHGLSIRGWDGFLLDNWFSFNQGAGIATIEENNAVTITGNRLEWNRQGGIRILNGSHYNITGNYIDRCGPAILFAATDDYVPDPARIVGQVGYSTITGNMLYRSGRPEWSRNDPFASAHLVLRGVRGVTVTGNTMVVGRDDENNAGSLGFNPQANWSPELGVIAEKLRNVIIRDNAMDAGALRELIQDRGGHGGAVVIRDNVGDLFRAGDQAEGSAQPDKHETRHA